MKRYIFKFDTIFSAYYIFEGLVYMKDDENKFISNHKNLLQETYKMSI